MDVNQSLFEAIQNRATETVELLLKRGVDVNAVGTSGYTPLHLPFRETPLHMAVEKGYLEIVRILLSYGANVNVEGEYRRTPLHMAVRKGYQEIVKILLSNGADVNVEDDFGSKPLVQAFERRSQKIIRILLSKGADVNSESRYAPPPLHLAVKRGYQEIIKIILSKGADVNAKDRSGSIPLHIAFEKGYQEFEFFFECQEEIANMKIEKINRADISFYDILTKNVSSLAIYMRNENIVAVLKSDNYASKFPNYFSMIKRKFGKGMERKELLEQANQIFSFFVINFDCSDKIASYLSNQDIKMLIDAFKPLSISRRPI